MTEDLFACCGFNLTLLLSMWQENASCGLLLDTGATCKSVYTRQRDICNAYSVVSPHWPQPRPPLSHLCCHYSRGKHIHATFQVPLRRSKVTHWQRTPSLHKLLSIHGPGHVAMVFAKVLGDSEGSALWKGSVLSARYIVEKH